MSNEDLCVLVVSCDKYSDLWDIFFKLLFKYWAECKYNIYLGTNFLEYSNKTIKTICIGEDKAWANNVKNMLAKIKEDYIILLLEDFFFDRKVSDQKIDMLFEYVKKNDIDCLRLTPCPPPFRTIDRERDLGIIESGEPYYVSTQPAIWKKKVLNSLLHDGYSAWDFEKKNSNNTVTEMKFLSVNHKVLSHRNAVERGKYYPSTIRFLKKEKINPDFITREVIKNNELKRLIKLKCYKISEWIFIKLRLYRRKT